MRLIAATHRPLHEMVETGDFGSDMLYRLQAMHVELPPLRDHRDDVPSLAAHFIAHFSERN